MANGTLARMLRFLRSLSRFLEIFGAIGVVYAVYSALSRKPRLVRVASRWTDHPVFVRLNTSDIAVFCQVFLEEEYSIVQDVLPPPSTIVDAGANIGLTAVYLAQKFPMAKIYSIEPEPSNMALLLKNTASYANVHALQAALWSKDAPLELDPAITDSWGIQVRESNAEGQTNAIRGLRLRTLLDSLGLDRLSLLKMDIEGAEYEVLADHPDWINRVDAVVAELHESIRPGCGALFEAATRSFTRRRSHGELTLAGKASN